MAVPLVFTNARLFTGAGPSTTNSTEPTTLVVQDGKIAFVGTPDAPAFNTYAHAPATDLNGAYILPGFIDAHTHFLLLGQSLAKVQLDGCKDLADIRARISAYVAQHPEKERVLCSGWMHSMTGGVALASMLDDLTDKPVYIDSKDLHSCWCNSAALREMGVEDMPDPDGGRIERDGEGNASGLLSEACVLLIVWPHLARVLSTEEKLASLRAAIKAYHAVGVTGAIDMAMDDNAWAALLALRDAEGGSLPIRIAAHWCINPGTSEADRLAQVDRAIELAGQYNSTTSPDLRVVGIKLICDGVIDACTAALSEPYTTNVASPDPIWTPAMLAPVVAKASSASLQCALHAIGDLAVSNAITALRTHATPHLRHRIEHLELTSPASAALLGALNITASIQPVHADPAILRAWPALLGPARLARAFAYADFAAHGAVLALGSDAPTAPHPPLANLYVATTRKSARDPAARDAPVNEGFKLGIAQAVTAATRGAAYSCFAEERVGTLEVGKEADFVVVEMRFEAEELLRARVLQTWFGGQKVFAAEKVGDGRTEM
ncbi:amidohydrolase family protein-like protein [Paraphaeosphaeria sporulosa]|uniref:Amidohydrolase family protein-like protein n=1 Tax=Paraphaeosphaeria sporulosa TaxID=1460663 RepID=A0A177CCN8_9PLEO|nr:amidohydrolase family protein-like protein [Paraphaeosphaeria sporulosa]OAG04652.1 amidohydrolase family protein-like protein [Paraphaeosphaeria sporulosa]